MMWELNHYYENYVTERLQTLQTQLDAERAKANPDNAWIRSLETRIWWLKNN